MTLMSHVDPYSRLVQALVLGLGASTCSAAAALRCSQTRHPEPPTGTLHCRRCRSEPLSRRAAAARRSHRTFTGVPKEEVKKCWRTISCRRTTSCSSRTRRCEHRRQLIVRYRHGQAPSCSVPPLAGNQKSMAEAGIKPEDIDAVVCSHAISTTSAASWTQRQAAVSRTPRSISPRAISILDRRRQVGSPVKDFIVHARRT